MRSSFLHYTLSHTNANKLTTMSSSSTPPPPLEIVFVHLDLGIGGAEQLVLSLAQASLQEGHTVHLVTSNCLQSHCFDAVKKPNGILCENLHVWGNWIPSSILNMGGTALCSSIRLAYLCCCVSREFPNADLCVLDVLSTPIPLLLPYFSVLFYCHFPDQLLTRDTVNGEIIVGGEGEQRRSVWKSWYRRVLDALEEATMNMADLIVVNSNFTQQVIQETFSAALQAKPMRVLYPSLSPRDNATSKINHKMTSKTLPIVSLNRYERKKNIELLLQAYALLQEECDSNRKLQLPPLIIAGGYNVLNVENVQYRGELDTLAKTLGIYQNVTFLISISDHQRQELFQQALCVVYTPHLEHFGIVPLEAMAAGTPVVAVNSGGPKETVIHGMTGFLCDATPQAFYKALLQYVQDPSLADKMGMAGRQHVLKQFSQERFQQEWSGLTTEAVETGRRRLRQSKQSYAVYKGLFVVMEAMVALLVVLCLTLVLRAVGILEHDAHIVGSIKRALLNRDEL